MKITFHKLNPPFITRIRWIFEEALSSTEVFNAMKR